MRRCAWMLLCGGIFAAPRAGATDGRAPLALAKLPRVATVDERYQSYELETADVMGDSSRKTAPLDLSRPVLRKLAAALGPAWVRVSGSSAYFHDSDAPPPALAPKGFQGVLTRSEWKGVIDFAHAANAKIATSFAIGAGVRDAAGAWTPDQARKLLAYTKSAGGQIAAAELFAQPTLPPLGGAPAGHDAAAFGRDVAAFRRFAKNAAPAMLVVGPGTAGEGIAMPSVPTLHTEDLLGASPRPVFDVFSYADSSRCATAEKQAQTAVDEALSEAWLSRSGKIFDSYAALRDRFLPKKPIWVTETADAACGGNAWDPTFLDAFRYLDQLAHLAKHGVKVHMHPLAAGDDGLIDAKTLTPRPDYWAALLWRRLMGTTVLDAGPSREGLHLYAHCLRGHRGGVALLAINNTRNQPESIEVPSVAERYTLSAKRLQQSRVDLNANELRLKADGELPELRGVPTLRGTVVLAPATITFVAVANAGNRGCM